MPASTGHLHRAGRAKIPITWIKSDASRHVTFTKRKKGLKKKVEELAILCGVEVCMICFGPQAGKPSSVPYSWGLPGVAHVISKYRSLSKEEQDKKKLDNTSLLEQQIKKLKTELKLKVEQNRNLENERAYFLWDDRLNGYGVDDLKQLAEMVIDRTRQVYDKIAYISQQQDVIMQGFRNDLNQRASAGLLVDDNNGNNASGDANVLSSSQLHHDQLMTSSMQQGPYQQLVANLNLYNNVNAADNPSSSFNGTGLMNANAPQSYHHGSINPALLSLTANFMDDPKANINQPMPHLNNSGASSSGNFYLNINTMLPSSSDAPTYVLNPSLSSKAKQQDQLAAEPHLLSNASLHPALLKMKLEELMEPQILSNMTWQQAVGLQPDHNYTGAYSGSSSSQERQQQGRGHHSEDEAQWSGDNMVDDEGTAGGSMNMVESVPFHISVQTIRIDESGQFSMSGINNGQSSISAENVEFGVSAINSGQPSILQLDIGQLAAITNESEESVHHVKGREGALMWSLDEENTKMNTIYHDRMLSDQDAGPLDKGLTDLENAVKESNDALLGTGGDKDVQGAHLVMQE